MVSEGELEGIRRTLTDIHLLAMSHIVAADHATMIGLVQQIKAEEAALDGKLAGYERFVPEDGMETYRALLEDYDAFKHALVYLVCASADSKTQDAYATANGDVATWSSAAEADIDALYAAVSSQAEEAKDHLTVVYVTSLITSTVTLVLGVLLVAAAFRIIRKYVITPIRDAMGTLQDSSERISGVVGEVRRRTRTDRTALRRPGGDLRQHSRHPRQRGRHPGRHQGHGGGVRRHHGLLPGHAGTGREYGTLRPGGDGGSPHQGGGDHVHAEQGH